MSKLVNIFNNHAFHNSWKLAKEEVNSIDEKELIEDIQLMELARARKVIDYIDNYLKLIEPDLNTSNITQFLNDINNNCVALKNETSNFKSSKNSSYLSNMNNNLDAILSLIRHFNISLPKFTGRSISDMLKNYNDTINKALEEINLSSVISDSNTIKELAIELFDDSEQESISKKINNSKTDIEQKHSEIIDFYNNTLNDKEFDDTTKEIIEKAKNEILEANETTKEVITELNAKIENFEKYYIKIFGEPNEENIRVGGLKNEIEEQKAKLDIFEKEQQEKHNKILAEKLEAIKQYETETQLHTKNLHAQIESHLPGATSAGLAEAYHIERNKFADPIKQWNIVFIVSLGIMFLGTFLTFIHLTSNETGWTLSFSDVKGIEDTLNNLLYKLPLYAPLIWLAIYASKRRSENQRLEQEYAHKEALARSYSSYKQQIEALNEQDQTLLKKLLESSIDTVSKNASESLDKKHGDNLPTFDMIEKVGELIKKVSLK